MISQIIDRGMSIVLTAAAVSVAIVALHREFGSRSDQPSASAPGRPTKISNWQELVSAGEVIGSASAPVKIVEFADFECPFCRRFTNSFTSVHEKFGDKVALVFVHYPLVNLHRFAMPAAKSAECAAEQGQFAEFHDELFAKQDSLGLKTWSAFARDAGVKDLVAFDRCNVGLNHSRRIDQGVALAKKLGLHATPSVFINGWQFPSPPSDSTLSVLINAFLTGQDPQNSIRTVGGN